MGARYDLRMDDLERARAWWVRVMGYMAPGQESKVQALAEEFRAIRSEVSAKWGRDLHAAAVEDECPKD